MRMIAWLMCVGSILLAIWSAFTRTASDVRGN